MLEQIVVSVYGWLDTQMPANLAYRYRENSGTENRIIGLFRQVSEQQASLWWRNSPLDQTLPTADINVVWLSASSKPASGGETRHLTRPYRLLTSMWSGCNTQGPGDLSRCNNLALNSRHSSPNIKIYAHVAKRLKKARKRQSCVVNIRHPKRAPLTSSSAQPPMAAVRE
ncbi:hypothetical protein PoB_005923200 [Plakobranchus ocellatus]|uniref:Uncharacterized protein n=1 Tax=Plakobranchus ocellatus TaxID=259542 RepID=A0AAV4CLI7_9GAST|nr:hypothetical protein PoB_005923200 [Plakobranchus ocellatus]